METVAAGVHGGCEHGGERDQGGEAALDVQVQHHLVTVYSTVQYSTVQYSTVVSLGPGLAWRREEMDFKLNVDPISCCQAAVLATLPVSCSHSPPADRGAGGGWRGRGCGDWTELLIHVSVLVCLHLGQSQHSVLAFPDNKIVILQIDNFGIKVSKTSYFEAFIHHNVMNQKSRGKWA